MTEGDDREPTPEGRDPEPEEADPIEDSPASGAVRAEGRLPPVPAAFQDSPPPANDPRPATPDAVYAYLSRPDVLARLTRQAHQHVSASNADDLTQDAVEAMLTAKTLPESIALLPAWAFGVMNLCKKNRFRGLARRAKYEGEVVDIEEFANPTPSSEPEEVQLTPWLVRETRKNPRDAETLELLTEKARHRLTNDALAERHGMTGEAFRKRINRFVATYKSRRRLYLRKLGLLAIVVAVLMIALVALAKAIFGILLHGAEPSPAAPTPREAPSLLPSAHDVPFEPARPTEPSRTVPAPRDSKGPPKK